MLTKNRNNDNYNDKLQKCSPAKYALLLSTKKILLNPRFFCLLLFYIVKREDAHRVEIDGGRVAPWKSSSFNIYIFHDRGAFNDK